MNMNRTLAAIAVIALIGATSHAYAGKGNQYRWGRVAAATTETAQTTESVSEEVVAVVEDEDTVVEESASSTLAMDDVTSMMFMREEEKLARDVYQTLHDIWGQPIFENISNSEQKHMDAMANLLEQNSLPDPVSNDANSVFQNGELRQMYWDLVARGSQSVLEALYAGAYIEELDMRDLQDAINGTARADAIAVYENLLKGSRNHLRAFVRQIENLGVAYEAQVISQEEVDAITGSAMETGATQRGRGRWAQ